LRDLASQFFSGQPAALAAHRIAEQWLRYTASGAAGRERNAEECPAHRWGTPYEFYWALSRINARPLGNRAVRKAITAGTEFGFSMPADCATVR